MSALVSVITQKDRSKHVCRAILHNSVRKEIRNEKTSKYEDGQENKKEMMVKGCGNKLRTHSQQENRNKKI
jgi:hypothetical protein